MTVTGSLLFYSILMAALSFLSGLPAFWIQRKFEMALPLMVKLTSGLLISTCINLVIPEAIENLSSEKLHSASFGPLILLGFIVLYLTDIFSEQFTEYLQSSINLDEGPAHSIARSYFLSVVSNSTTLALLLHCLSDGIILATTLLSEPVEESSSTWMIILAIFLHKLPASFSLTSILLYEKLELNIIIFHLFLFSVSAPIGAWLTYGLSKIIDFPDTSFVLLFSTGAFLYIGFHTFLSCHTNAKGSNNNWNFLITIIGMIIPMLVSLLHD